MVIPMVSWALPKYGLDKSWSYGYESLSMPVLNSLLAIFISILAVPLVLYYLGLLLQKALENYQTGNILKTVTYIVNSILLVVFCIVVLCTMGNTAIHIIDKDKGAVVFRITNVKGLITERPEYSKPVRVTEGTAVPGIDSQIAFRVILTIPFIEKIKPFPLSTYELKTPIFQTDTKKGVTEHHMYATIKVMVADPIKYTTSVQNPNKALKKASLFSLNSIIQNFTEDKMSKKAQKSIKY